MHRASPRFWRLLEELPESIQRLARKNYQLLEQNPRHPSLRFKKVGELWSARVGRGHRALAVEDGDDFIWVWIGTHADYDRLIR